MANISCDLHDYFEIVCMRQSQVRIDTQGDFFKGVAMDIVVKDNGENLLLKTEEGQRLIALTDIDKLESMDNAIDAHNFVVKIK